MDLMNRNWWKKCRVCNKDGSKNIFEKLHITSNSTSLQTVSSTDKLLEKFRFVTMIKIDEFDNKPKMLCDLCIIQLNVSYQFKTLAMEMDTKHQQYAIENGIHHSPNSDNSTLQFIEHSTFERSSTTQLRPLTLPGYFSNVQQRRLIKSEPTDYEIMSDITIDTNTDRVEDADNNVQPFDGVNMVCVNDVDMLRSNGDSDIEFINNCLPTMAFRQYEKPANSMTTQQSTTTRAIGLKDIPKVSQLVIAGSKSINNNPQVTETEPVEKLSESVLKDSPSKKSTSKLARRRKTKKNYSNDFKKNLRPKSNKDVNYSLVKRRKNQKVINPINKMRQAIKEENENPRGPSTVNSLAQPVSTNGRRLATSPKHRLILKGQHKSWLAERNNRFRAEPQVANRPYHNGNTNVKMRQRQITIRDTDRFKLAVTNMR